MKTHDASTLFGDLTRLEHFLVFSGSSVRWAIPAARVVRVCEVQETFDTAVHNANRLLDLDEAAHPERVVILQRPDGVFGLTVFGPTEMTSCPATSVLQVPELVRRDPAGRLLHAVIIANRTTAAWVLDVNALNSMDGNL